MAQEPRPRSWNSGVPRVVQGVPGWCRVSQGGVARVHHGMAGESTRTPCHGRPVEKGRGAQ